MAWVRPDEWTPVDVDSLERAADTVVRSRINSVVVAGPGAGKTELLAQRACFLLQTGTCPPPHRILAISFKRDAAKNLMERVRKRCGERARRFDSFTLDAFAKSFVDRFRSALPAEWRPSAGHEVRTESLSPDAMRVWFTEAGVPPGQRPIDFRQFHDTKIRSDFYEYTHGYTLPYSANGLPPLARHFGLLWWRHQRDQPLGRPGLTFPMLNRLAAYLLRTNPKLASALRATYSYVFMDEFQDTTAPQYDLIRAAFLGSGSVMTAVGDAKQRIMLWAGAMEHAFDLFRQEFIAKPYHLVRNYRSAPELVHMQQAIAEAIEARTPSMEAMKVADVEGVCSILEYSNPEQEASHVGNLIYQGITLVGLNPRDFCILARQRVGQIIEPLRSRLRDYGIRLRDESELQDLLSEPLVQLLLSVLRLATRPRDPEAWDSLTHEISFLYGFDLTEDAKRLEREAKRVLQWCKSQLVCPDFSIETLIPGLVSQIGQPSLRAKYRQYATGSFQEQVMQRFDRALSQALAAVGNMAGAVDEVIGADVIPAMTIHKSKGLEFHTVIFLGLEDSQWWNFANQSDEEKRGFFVAFSRAIHCVIFTFSDWRNERRGLMRQGRNGINDLYAMLQRAGVQASDLRGPT